MTRFYTAVCFAVLSTTLVFSLSRRPPYDLIVVQVPAESRRESSERDRPSSVTDRYVDGSRIVLLPASGSDPVILTPEFLAAGDPEVSFDGMTILFAGKRRSGDTWQIWRMSRDGSGKVQVTRGDGHSVAPAFAGARFYLDDPEPTPQIIFAGASHGAPWSLYGTDVDGEVVRRLSFNLYDDFGPDVLPNGRIVFASWQRSGGGPRPDGHFALMDINIDGTDVMPFYGNHELPRYKGMVQVSDFDDRVYFIESDRNEPLRGGSISVVSQRRPLGSYRRVSDDPEGLYHSPCPLPDGGLIASYRSTAPGEVFGLYAVDPESGRRGERIFVQSGWHTIDAQVLTSRPAVPGRSNWLIPGSTTGVFYTLNAYRTNLPVDENIAPGTIRYVRVIEGVGGADGTEHRRLLGMAPVEADGSFHIRVPAETPLTFQLLDEDYVALRTQHAWTWVMGNENRGCIGCHENRELAPPNRMAAAVMKPPVELTLPAERRRTVDFRHQIAPLVESKCATAECHVASHAAPDLSGVRRASTDEAVSPVYRTLLDSLAGRARYVVPGRARHSRLIQLLLSGNTDSATVPSHGVLRPRERMLFIEWVDLGAAWDARDSGVTNQR